MENSNINVKAKEKLISIIPNFKIEKGELEEKQKLRTGFKNKFNKEKIKDLSVKEYFMGHELKEGCFSYELEHGTIKIGSIRGGSNFKFGHEENFDQIKKIIENLLDFEDKEEVFYLPDGEPTLEIKEICEKSLVIKGFKSGRSVLGKILSIYYPNVFLPIFNHQENFLENLHDSYSSESFGLELFIVNNYFLLKAKKELIEDPAFESFKEELTNNDGFTKLLYTAFPIGRFEKETPSIEEETFKALERQNYQKLIHRNFKKLFPDLEYYELKTQCEKDGQYDTGEVGIMDFLAKDKKGNLVVIELKIGGSDSSLGQICRYMGWAKENLCKENQKIRGIIIAERQDLYLEYALKVTKEIKFVKMKLDVELIENV